MPSSTTPTRQPRNPGPTPRVLTPRALAAELAAATRGTGARTEVALTATATGLLLLGGPAPLLPALWARLSSGQDPLQVVRPLWEQATTAAPFLTDRLGALLDWSRPDRVRPEDERALAACAQVMTRVDLPGTAEQPAVGGELLGPLYTLLRGHAGQSAMGAFFTPMTVASAMARLSDVTAQESFTDPCCGAGVMAVATARAMREAGRDPATVRWVLNDLDPLAVALAGVNALVHGLGRDVTLTCQDTLRPA